MNRLLRFDGRVAVVTGAGGGLGKAYALLLAERGAAVVVNDLGGARDGEGRSSGAADEVVEQIKKNGGEAVANYDSVTSGDSIIKTAMDKFGRIDILINNAGILRDKSFAKMSSADWEKIHQVHLEGAFRTTRAAWDHFRNQKYGRVIMTSSGAGLLGNFGQANYAAAKAGLVGFAQTLAVEGIKFNIHTNSIAPLALSRLTEDIFPQELHSAFRPELIAPVVCWMCHEDCTENGSVIESCAGVATKYQWLRGPGALLRSSLNEPVRLEGVKEKWEEVTNMDRAKGDMPSGTQEMLAYYLRSLEKISSEGSAEKLSRKTLVDYELPSREFTYNIDDAILYALGVGMSTTDPHSLNYLYENAEDFRVLPTFPSLAGLGLAEEIYMHPDLGIDPTQIIHGEQYVEVYRALEPSATLKVKGKVVDVLDKITGTLYIIKAEGEDANGPLFMLETSIFEMGSGKFGGNRMSKKPLSKPLAPPQRKPDAVLEFTTSQSQAALYRLSGDKNPLHIDPSFAAAGGFPRPILHGLCSFGIAGRLILANYGNGDPSQFKAIKVRFSKPVYPGDTLQVETWAEGNRVHFEARVKGTDDTTLSGGYVDFKTITPKLQSRL